LVLTEDNRLTRAGLVALIRGRPGFRVHASSADIVEALRLVRDTTPDIVVLNMGHADDNALTLAGALHGETPASRIVVMGLSVVHVDVESLVRAGVAGLVMTDCTFSEFLETVQRVAQGEPVLPPALAGALFGQLKRHVMHWRRKPVTGAARLSVREREVADLIVRGLSNKAVAQQLAIALHTVKSHVHRVLAKLDCNTRLEVAAFAQHGSRGFSGSKLPPPPTNHSGR
jgi:two-component system nitrate/nitrite response regulator NarL